VKPIRRLLIANRGEIAVRIIRACRALGLAPLAVYSPIDAGAPHVRLADAAWPLPADAPAESYLNIARLREIARAAGADAIHPGYGFLAENPAFAAACAAAGLSSSVRPPRSWNAAATRSTRGNRSPRPVSRCCRGRVRSATKKRSRRRAASVIHS